MLNPGGKITRVRHNIMCTPYGAGHVETHSSIHVLSSLLLSNANGLAFTAVLFILFMATQVLILLFKLCGIYTSSFTKLS